MAIFGIIPLTFISILYGQLFLNLTHLPLVPHICVSERVGIDSDKGLLPIGRQAII